jgi:DNA uptake protein ComE-like DNA-binding protein
MEGPDRKLRTAILSFSVILFCVLVVRSPLNTPSLSGNSPAPILVELQGDIPGPGVYLFEKDRATISKAFAAAGWTGTFPESLADRKLVSGQTVTLLNGADKPEITVSSMAAAVRLSAGQKLDLNTASADDLLLIPKMRAAMAEAIVKRREAKAWESVSELREIHGIGPKTSQWFEEYLQIVPRQ